MSKTIKLSKSDWMRVGVEAGYIKGAEVERPIMVDLHSRLQELVSKIDAIGPADLRHPKLEDNAEKLYGDIIRFTALLDTYGS